MRFACIYSRRSWVFFLKPRLASMALPGCATVSSEWGVCLHTSETSGVVGLCGLPVLPPPPASPQLPLARKACLLPSAACSWFGDQPT